MGHEHGNASLVFSICVAELRRQVPLFKVCGNNHPKAPENVKEKPVCGHVRRSPNRHEEK